MNIRKLIVTVVALLGLAGAAQAGDYDHSTTGVAGYDLVSYHQPGGPVRGNGHHVAVHDGVTYLFASADNKTAFEAAPAKYLPAYGGYCAFGVSVSKKFVADPEVWRVVDGRLYLNLDRDIQRKWLEDVPGRIASAEAAWPVIRDKSPAEL